MSSRGDDVRVFYRRLVIGARPEELLALEAQIAGANIIALDLEHDSFELPSDFNGPDVSTGLETICGTYRDADGRNVNVIVHLTEGRLSSAERYRDLGDAIIQWPPAPDGKLQFLRYGD